MLRALFHILCSALLLVGLCVAASAKEAGCEVTLAADLIDGACDFVGHKGGSFDVTMRDGRRFGGADRLSLQVLKPGIGEITDSRGNSYGAANRSEADPACWVAEEVTLCVRAKGEALRADPVAAGLPLGGPQVVTGRCHMGECWWVRIDAVEQIGGGSAAYPGRLMRAIMRYASQEGSGDDFPQTPPLNSALWEEPAPAEFFCSPTRPAVLQEDGTWMVLPLPEVFGATEGITNIYLHVCHGDTGEDPYEAAKRFAYHAGELQDAFPDFAALTGG